MDFLYINVVSLFQSIYFIPGDFLLTCLDRLEISTLVNNTDRAYIRVLLSGFSIIFIIGYLMYCVDETIDIGPRFRINFKNAKSNIFYLIVYLIILFLIFNILTNCYIKFISIALFLFIFYYSIGNRRVKIFKKLGI
jgi:hypothetical protein